MRLIISPAKKMREDTDSFPYHSLPRFLPQTREILAALRAMSPAELQALWKCSDRIDPLQIHRTKKGFIDHQPQQFRVLLHPTTFWGK